MPCKNNERLDWEEINNKEKFKNDFSIEWVISSSKQLKSHKVIVYKCKNYSQEVNCPMKLKRIILENFTEKMYHLHTHNTKCRYKTINAECNSSLAIKELLEQNVTKAWEIKRTLEKRVDEKGINLFKNVDIKKIYNVIAYQNSLNKKMNKQITSDMINKICQEKNNLPSDEDNAFILAYSINPIRIIFTSTKLLKNLSRSENVHIDATYEINSLNYPIVVIGFSDITGRFHLYGICIIESEGCSDYEWIFASFKNYCVQNGINLHPKYVIADCSKAISSAVAKIYPNIIRIHCWAHVWRLIYNKIRHYKEFTEILSTEIHFLQKIYDINLFKEGMVLFLNKWQQIENLSNFISEFKKLYVTSNNNWNEASYIFGPSTNNALERFNLTIKTRYTNYKIIDLLNFIEKVIPEIIKNVSQNTSSNVLNKMIYNDPNILHLANIIEHYFYTIKEEKNRIIILFSCSQV